MKSLRVPLLLAASGLLAVSAARAQTVQYIVVSKEQYFTQTGNATVSGPGNFVFNASAQGFNQVGNNLSGISAPSLTSTPGGSGPVGTMVYDPSDDSWSLDSNYGTGGALESAYNAGNFGLTILGTPLTVGLPNETPRFTDAPLATLSAGTISGGVLVWDPSQSLTITLNSGVPFGGAGTGIDVMGLNVYGPSVTDFQRQFGVSSLTTTIDPNTFLAGQTYTVELTYMNIVGGTAPAVISGGPLDGAQYGGIYERTTTFSIQAIPEPSTYAALAGLAALGLAAFFRQRQRVAATA